jgi:peptidoglycan/LPS O-acetylase OafA/YrhL
VKVRFANQLRGVAALLVVIYHYLGIFFAPGVRSSTGTPDSFVPLQPAYAQHVLSRGPSGFFAGIFAVGILLLISGFVIPISMRNISIGQFLTRRVFRIYPVYWLCLLISIAMYCVCSWYWSTPLSDRISLPFLASNIPLVHSVAGFPSLDFVCWTVGVELKFYVVFALATLAGKTAHRIMALCVGFLTLCCGIAFASTHGLISWHVVAMVVADMKFMTFIFLGCLFYYVLYREISAKAALGYGAIIYALFVAINSFYGPELFGALSKSYTYALILFLACYLLRDRFKEIKVLDFLADISFPLYLLHSAIGYVGMPILMNKGMSFTLAWMISLGVSILVAYAVHRFVELPVIAFGKKVSSSKGSKVAEVGQIA